MAPAGLITADCVLGVSPAWSWYLDELEQVEAGYYPRSGVLSGAGSAQSGQVRIPISINPGQSMASAGQPQLHILPRSMVLHPGRGQSALCVTLLRVPRPARRCPRESHAILRRATVNGPSGRPAATEPISGTTRRVLCFAFSRDRRLFRDRLGNRSARWGRVRVEARRTPTAPLPSDHSIQPPD